MPIKITIILIISFIFNFKVSSKVLIFDVSKKNSKLSEENSEPDFIIFGYTDSKEPLVIKIKGPEQKVILQKKNKVLGMWSWSKTGSLYIQAYFIITQTRMQKK